MTLIVTNQFNVSTVEKGDDAIRLDLSNDNDSILYVGGAAKNSCVTDITLYDGPDDVTSQATLSHAATNCTASRNTSGNGRQLTVTAITGDNVKGTVTVSASYKGKTYTTVFTVTKLTDKDRYEIICTPNAIAHNTTTGTSSASAITVELYKTPYTSGLRAKMQSLGTGLSLKYYVNNGTSATPITYSSGTGSVTVDTNNSSYRIVLASGNEELDSETIPINKSTNGNGVVSNTKTFAISAYSTAGEGRSYPSDISSWAASVTPTEAKPYIWCKEETVYTDTSKNTTVYYLTGMRGAKGDSGHVGRWYEYAGDYSGENVSLTNTDDHGWFIKKGDYFYMLTAASGTAVSTGTAPQGQDSNANWDYMGGDRKYYIATAVFAKNAYLGSFIVNKDWIISQKGVRGNDTDSSDYRYFDPAYPTTSVNGQHSFNGTSWNGYNFVPNWAVDAKTGATYQNRLHAKGDLTVESGSNYVKISAEGLEAKWGDEGFRIKNEGLKRRLPGTDTWVNFFSNRYVREITSGGSSIKGLSSYDDFVITKSGNSEDIKLRLPQSPASGKRITIQNIGRATNIYPTSGNKIHTDGGDVDYNAYVSLNNYDRAEFVYYGGYWYVTYMSPL